MRIIHRDFLSIHCDKRLLCSATDLSALAAQPAILQNRANPVLEHEGKDKYPLTKYLGLVFYCLGFRNFLADRN